MSGFGKIYESSNWGVGVCDNTIGWGSSYKSIANCTDASFSYSSDSFAQNGSNPTPTITGDAGGTFTATPSGLSLNASTGEITLSTSTINSYTIRYTLPDTTFAEQTVGITAAPFASTRSFSFDGVDDYFDTNSNLLGSTFSVSMWFKADSYPSTNPALISQFSSGISGRFFIGVRDNGGRKITAFLNSHNYGSTVINTGTWYHLTLVNDNNTVTLYLNGSVDGNFTFSTSVVNTNTLIGAISASSNLWDGNIDEVGIWNSALSSTAVTEIYNSGVPNDLDELTNASDPNVWYRCGE